MRITITAPQPEGLALIGCRLESEQACGRVVGYETYHGQQRVCVACQPVNTHSWRWLPITQEQRGESNGWMA